MTGKSASICSTLTEQLISLTLWNESSTKNASASCSFHAMRVLQALCLVGYAPSSRAPESFVPSDFICFCFLCWLTKRMPLAWLYCLQWSLLAPGSRYHISGRKEEICLLVKQASLLQFLAPVRFPWCPEIVQGTSGTFSTGYVQVDWKCAVGWRGMHGPSVQLWVQQFCFGEFDLRQ